MTHCVIVYCLQVSFIVVCEVSSHERPLLCTCVWPFAGWNGRHMICSVVFVRTLDVHVQNHYPRTTIRQPTLVTVQQEPLTVVRATICI